MSKRKVLLLGDYSAYFKNLSVGFSQIGWDAHYYSHGDYWKKIEGLPYPAYPSNILGKALRILKIPIDRLQFKGYDLVLFLAPTLILNRRDSLTYESLLKNNKKVMYCSCGSHDPYFQESLHFFDYHPFDHLDITQPSSEFPKLSIDSSLRIKEGLSKASGIVTISPMYDYGYKKAGIKTHRIPLPISDFSEPLPSKKNGPIIIQHGISRKGFKGSNFIIEAMKEIESKYPRRVQIDIPEKLPFNEYLARLNKADIVLDQCKSQGYGMNALLAMARGRVTMSGCEQTVAEFLGQDLEKIPVINIVPDTNQIISSLESVLQMDNRDLHQLQMLTLKYTKSVHNARKVAYSFANAVLMHNTKT